MTDRGGYQIDERMLRVAAVACRILVGTSQRSIYLTDTDLADAAEAIIAALDGNRRSGAVSDA